MAIATHDSIQLTSGEMGAIWTAYVNESMAKCVLQFFLRHVTNSDISPIVKLTLDESTRHISVLTKLMQKENFPIPAGFTEQDVRLDSPKAFQDTFYLMYIRQMAKLGMMSYGGFMSMMARYDVIDYFKKCLFQSTELYEKTTELSNQMGILIRPPYIPVPEKVDFVDDKSYLGVGFNLFSDYKRPLNAIEIAHLCINTETSLLVSMLGILFAQTASNKDVRSYMVRAKDIAQKHVQLFADKLIESDMQAPMSWDTAAENVSTPIFSDKLMMFHMAFLAAAGIGNYGVAASASQRADVAGTYVRLAAELSEFAKDGADILIEHGWMEEPPQAPDRRKLIGLH